MTNKDDALENNPAGNTEKGVEAQQESPSIKAGETLTDSPSLEDSLRRLNESLGINLVGNSEDIFLTGKIEKDTKEMLEALKKLKFDKEFTITESDTFNKIITDTVKDFFSKLDIDIDDLEKVKKEKLIKCGISTIVIISIFADISKKIIEKGTGNLSKIKLSADNGVISLNVTFKDNHIEKKSVDINSLNNFEDVGNLLDDFNIDEFLPVITLFVSASEDDDKPKPGDDKPESSDDDTPETGDDDNSETGDDDKPESGDEKKEKASKEEIPNNKYGQMYAEFKKQMAAKPELRNNPFASFALALFKLMALVRSFQDSLDPLSFRKNLQKNHLYPNRDVPKMSTFLKNGKQPTIIDVAALELDTKDQEKASTKYVSSLFGFLGTTDDPNNLAAKLEYAKYKKDDKEEFCYEPVTYDVLEKEKIKFGTVIFLTPKQPPYTKLVAYYNDTAFEYYSVKEKQIQVLPGKVEDIKKSFDLVAAYSPLDAFVATQNPVAAADTPDADAKPDAAADAKPAPAPAPAPAPDTPAEAKVTAEKALAEAKDTAEKALAAEKELADKELAAAEKELADKKTTLNPEELAAAEKELADKKAAIEKELADKKAAIDKEFADKKAAIDKDLADKKAAAAKHAADAAKPVADAAKHAADATPPASTDVKPAATEVEKKDS